MPTPRSCWPRTASRERGRVSEGAGPLAGLRVVELASNDGYLLQHFLPLGVPVLGIEPAGAAAIHTRRPPGFRTW